MRVPPSRCSAIDRVVLEALELVERRQEGVLVVQVHDVADGHVVVAEVVQEAAAAGVVVQRPAGRVLDQAGLVLLGRDLPQLLEADAELLRLGVRRTGRSVAMMRLGQRAAHALGDEDVLAVQLHAGLEVAGRARRRLSMPKTPATTPFTEPSLVARRRRRRPCRDRSRRPAPRPARPASGRRCPARRCSSRGCA